MKQARDSVVCDDSVFKRFPPLQVNNVIIKNIFLYFGEHRDVDFSFRKACSRFDLKLIYIQVENIKVGV